MGDAGTTVYICSRGHRWPENVFMTFRPGDSSHSRCPECGEEAEKSQPPGGEEHPSTSPAPPREAVAGSSLPTIPGYAILEVVGHDASGVVYKARELARDRIVALKWMAAGRDGSTDGHAPFRFDAEAVRLRHPNIVPILATGQHDGFPFVVSESIEGKSVAEVVADKPMPVLAAAHLVETLARAVHEAHQQGVVHGDLKPANVLLASDPSSRFVDPERGQLTDETGRELIPRITGFGVRGPLAPEQGATCAADVYGLGAILYHLLTGFAPSPSPTPPATANPKVPRDLEAICLSCLEKDPARRLPDARALADALRQFLDSFITHFQCGRCGKSLKSNKPLRVGTTMVRCPRCGGQSMVEAMGGKPPSGFPPSTEEAPVAVDPPAPNEPAAPRPAPQVPSKTPPPTEPFAPPRSGSPLAAFTPTTPMSHPSQSSLAGMPRVAGYSILGELGRGGMGVVYKARHEKLKRVVALKMILLDPRANEQYLTRFQAEAEAVARLHHPNIVQIFEIGEQDGAPFLALEFVTGGTLKKRLDGKPQPARAAAQMVQILARAVHAAHLRGIVHLDIKPANILLQPSSLTEAWAGAAGDPLESAQLYGVPKISDFGLAKRIDDDANLVGNGEVLGTPLYMAPEQAKGQSEEIGPGSDVYSLGVILYEMLTGRTPFTSASVLDILRQVVSEAPRPPRELQRNLPRDLEAICLRCLEKDPRNRYHSALALAEDLERFLNGDPVQARPPSAPARLWNWSLHNPVPSTLLLTVSAVLLFGQWSLRHLADRMVETTAEESAAQQTELLRAMNSFYTEVAARAKAAGVEVTHKYPEVENSIPIPAKFTIELGQRMQSLAESGDHAKGLDQSFMQLKLYSDHPFRRRNDSPPNHQFGKEALAFYRKGEHQDQPFNRIEKTRAGARVLRYATPLIMEERCLKCHNNPSLYELDKYRKTDWEVGDIRGVLEIVCPLEANTEQTQQMLFSTYMQVGGTAVAVLTLSWLALAIGRRARR